MVRYRLFDLDLANGLKKLLECIHKMSNQNLSEPHEQGELHRSLSNRHLQLIAIGGAIGTGLFMGSGKTISLAGPSILFIYLIIGVMVFFVMRALGELLLRTTRRTRAALAAGRAVTPAAGVVVFVVVFVVVSLVIFPPLGYFSNILRIYILFIPFTSIGAWAEHGQNTGGFYKCNRYDSSAKTSM